jgi:hypothetical protein
MYKGYKQGKVVATATTEDEVNKMKNNPVYRGIAWVKETADELPKEYKDALPSQKKAKDVAQGD